MDNRVNKLSNKIIVIKYNKINLHKIQNNKKSKKNRIFLNNSQIII